MTCVPLMAEEDVVVLSSWYCVIMLRLTLSEICTCFTKVLPTTRVTRNSIGAKIQGRERTGVYQVVEESV